MKSPYMMTPTLRLNLLTSTLHVARLLLAAIGLLSSFSMAAQAATFHVTTTADNGDNNNPTAGSLRKAILDADSNPGPDLIDFQIFPAGGVQTISPPSPLPVINDSVTIDGYTQPGASKNTLANGNNAVLMILMAQTQEVGLTASVSILVRINDDTWSRPIALISRHRYLRVVRRLDRQHYRRLFCGTDPTGTIALRSSPVSISIPQR